MEIDRKSTVGDLQKPICELFGKDFPATTVSLVVNEVVFEDFCAQPFRASTVSSEARVLFNGKVQAAAGRRSPVRARVDEQLAPSALKKLDIETAEPAPAAETSDTSATTSESQ